MPAILGGQAQSTSNVSPPVGRPRAAKFGVVPCRRVTVDAHPDGTGLYPFMAVSSNEADDQGRLFPVHPNQSESNQHHQTPTRLAQGPKGKEVT